MANSSQIQEALQEPYDLILFSKKVLSPVFGSYFTLNSSAIPASIQLNKTEQTVIQSVSIYGNINLEDGTEITCYEIILQSSVRIEQSKVAIQRYVRKLLTAGQMALVNFISPQKRQEVWRLTLIAKDSQLTEEGIKEKVTHAKRYTYLLGPSETCRTAAERFALLSTPGKDITFKELEDTFSVEKLSKTFFDEYTLHYQEFCNYLQEFNFRQSVFNISIPANATQTEKDKACKPIRDFVKKLLGRVVFLYFVQKKRWLGASDTQYLDGHQYFIRQLFKQSGGNDAFYTIWLTKLFFDTLNTNNTPDRKNDDFKMPDGTTVKVPFLNGGLFEREAYDKAVITLPAKLFSNPDFEDVVLTSKNKNYSRGFLDFLDAFNFTIHEDSPDDHTVAVDPEMLGHIFENLLEDNKDKGAFYTPKEIVHYMCQESLIEYLTTHLSKEYTIYREIGNAQVELFGNETRQGQLKMVESLGDKALNRDEVASIVKQKDISSLTPEQLNRIDQLLNSVKICDPAIGSGAFPMGLLQEIHAIKEIIAFELKHPWNPAKVKENIIQNSIYGVDIEKGAIDIARLRFWLSLVVDEEEPRALPNLDYKIVVGDSLVSKFEGDIIEIDWERKSIVGKGDELQRLLKEIAQKQRQFFKPDNADKKKLQVEIRTLKLELLINQLSYNKAAYENRTPILGGFAPNGKEIKHNTERELTVKGFEKNIDKLQQLKKNPDLAFEHFDWKLDFPEVLNPYLVNENYGFDIVVGNPPYLKERDNAHIFNDVNNSKLGMQWHQGKMDYWFYFLHVAINQNKKDGVIAFITSRYWLNSQGASKLIDRIQKELSFVNIVDIGKLKIFDNVAGHHMIHIYKKGIMNSFIYKKITNDLKSISNNYENGKVKHRLLINKDVFKNSNIILSTDQINSTTDTLLFDSLYDSSIGVQESVDKISSKQLKEMPNVNLFVGKGVFVLTESELASMKLTQHEMSVLKPYLDPNDVKKYHIITENKKYLIYSDRINKELIAVNLNYKNLKKHLDDLHSYITSSNKPYGIHRPRQSCYFENPKIIFKGMFIDPEFAYDESGYYFGFSFSSIIAKDKDYGLKYLLAVLNSNFAKHWFYQNGKIRGAGVDIGVEKLRTFPIAKTTNQKIFNLMVDYVLFLKKTSFSNLSNQLIPTYFEQIIDGMVYELYFSDLLKQHNREIIRHLSELPGFTKNMEDDQKMEICQSVFNRLNDREHPVRINLFYMNSIPEIAIIEGKNEDNGY